MPSFPFRTLEKIYNSTIEAFHAPMWKCLTRCEKLDIIEWRQWFFRYDEVDLSLRYTDFNVAGTPLAKCCLVKIDIMSGIRFRLDDEFKMLFMAAKIRRVFATPCLEPLRSDLPCENARIGSYDWTPYHGTAEPDA